MERQYSATDLGQRTSSVAEPVLDHAGKRCAQVVGTYGEIIGSEKNIPCAFDGADGHVGGAGGDADVQVAVAENLHTWRATSGVPNELNGTARSCAAIGDQRGTASGPVLELGEASLCAANRRPIVDDRGIGRVRPRSGEEHGAASFAADRTAVVGDGGTSRGRVAPEVDAVGAGVIGDGGTSRGRVVEEAHGAAESRDAADDRARVVDDRGISRGRVARELHAAAVVAKDRIDPRRRVVVEFYISRFPAVRRRKFSHEVLGDP